MTEVLDLAAALDRDTVKMPDGATFELRNHQEFGIVDEHRLRTLLEKITAFEATAADATEDEAQQASKMLRDLAAMLVIDPPEVIEDWVCAAVFAFWMKNAPVEEEAANPPKPAGRRTTGGSSRNSKPRTAVARKRGSTSRRTN